MSVERVTFVDGSWIELRDVADVTERQRRPYLASLNVPASADGAAQIEAIRRSHDLAAVAVIAGWSHELPITVDALTDLPSIRYDEILDACQSRKDQLAWSLVASPEAREDPKASIDVSSPSVPGSVTLTPPATGATSVSTPTTGVTTP